MSAGSGGVNKRKSYKIDLSAAYLKCGSISPCWWQLSQINTSLSDQVSGPRVATRCTDICRVAFSRPERHHGRAPGSAGDRSLFLIDIIEIISFPSSFCSVSYIARYFAFSSNGLLILHFGVLVCCIFYGTPCIWYAHSSVSIFIVIVIKVLYVVVVSFYAYLIWLELFWTSCILELDNGGDQAINYRSSRGPLELFKCLERFFIPNTFCSLHESLASVGSSKPKKNKVRDWAE